MNTIETSPRRIGRTSRMIQHAKTLAEEGRAVYIVTANAHHRQTLEHAIGIPNKYGIKVETSESLGNLDWQRCQLVRAHPNCVVLIDHYAIESRYKTLLSMLHAYDQPRVTQRFG